MTPVVLLPDAERLLSGWLRDQDEIISLVGDHVYTILPGNLPSKAPFVRITRVGSPPPHNHPLWIDHARLTIEAWGPRQQVSWQVAATVQAVMAQGDLVGRHDEGVVSGIQWGSLTDDPDPTYDPPMPRHILDATLITHPDPFPTPSTSSS